LLTECDRRRQSVIIVSCSCQTPIFQKNCPQLFRALLQTDGQKDASKRIRQNHYLFQPSFGGDNKTVKHLHITWCN